MPSKLPHNKVLLPPEGQIPLLDELTFIDDNSVPVQADCISPKPNKLKLNSYQSAAIEPEGELNGQRTPMPSYGEPGSYVSVTTRAVYLIASLDSFGRSNMRRGFRTASSDPSTKAPIDARYEDKVSVEAVRTGAQKNRKEFLDMAKMYFWGATGGSALAKTELMPGAWLSDAHANMWENFEQKYSGAHEENAARDKSRRLLRRGAKSLVNHTVQPFEEINVQKRFEQRRQARPNPEGRDVA